MESASKSFRSVQATVELCRDAEVALAACRRRKKWPFGPIVVEVTVTDEMRARFPDRYRPLPNEAEGRLWVRHPWTVRVEGQIGWEQQPWGPVLYRNIEIHYRHRTWTWDLRRGKFGPPTGSGGRPRGPIELFDPARLLRYWSLRSLGAGIVAGRPTIRVRAEPDPADQELQSLDMCNHLSWIENGADGWELDVDAERGVLLRFVAMLEGSEAFSVEFSAITFDLPIADEVFTFADCAGQEEAPLWHQRHDEWPGDSFLR